MAKQKLGRNSPCPCGSGKKFKRCHGVLNQITPDVIEQASQRLDAQRRQREKQQGLGRPIVSAVFKGHRFVAVGSRLWYAPAESWKTFADFLFFFIKKTLGEDWGNREIQKPFEQRHPILQWYHHLCLYQRQVGAKRGEVYSAPMTGAAAAYLNLSYNLYLVAHNNKDIQSKLIHRLKDRVSFAGAYYEFYVAAVFIKAGFDLEYENEDDRETSHCEFAAVSKVTGKMYSVEAKSCQPLAPGLAEGSERRTGRPRVGRQLFRALEKAAKHERVIFIDVNVPDSATDDQAPAFMEHALNVLRRNERTLVVKGAPAPPAYVVLTNHPYHHNLETVHFRRATLAEGFKIRDFKMGASFPSLRDALGARDRHSDMFRLMDSIREHYDIPSTFDGEIPEFAFNETPNRLLIGGTYRITGPDGKEANAILLDAIVSEEQKSVHCVYRLDNGAHILGKDQLSDAELAAYRRHPDTFFGVVRRRSQNADDPLQLFDFVYESYRNTSKAKLLEFMKGHPNIEELKQLDQKELAIRYCEQFVYAVMSRSKRIEEQ